MKRLIVAGPILFAIALAGGCGSDGVIITPTAVIVVTEGATVGAGTTLHLSAANSSSENGPIVQWKWTVDQPGGNNQTCQPDDSSEEITFLANVVGVYVFGLEVWDQTGCQAGQTSCEVTVEERQQESTAIRVRLTWVTPGDPDETDEGPEAGSDMDLHFLHPNAPENQPHDVDGDGQPDPYYDLPYDCFWYNRNPVWDGNYPVAIGPNPLLERDDTDGAGPEIVALANPPAGLVYDIAVHYWRDNYYGPSQPTVKVIINGVEQFSDTAPMMQIHDLWKVAQLAWPSGVITPYRDGADHVILDDYQNPDFFVTTARMGKK